MPNQICKTFSEITLYKKNTLLAIEKYQEIKVKGEKVNSNMREIMGFKNDMP